MSELRSLFQCKLAVMADLNAVNRSVILPKNPDIDMIRIAFSKSDVELAKELARSLLSAGYEVCLNFMSSHMYTPTELASHAADLPLAIPYVVDSLGCMSAADVQAYVSLLPYKCGIHLHNNLQQASGTYALVKCGLVDASIYGMGRGAGNLPLELCDITDTQRASLLGFYDIHMRNISRSWGYTPEFVMQAQLRCHPNYVVKMKDMGLDCQYIFKVISHLKGISKFDLEALYTVFETV